VEEAADMEGKLNRHESEMKEEVKVLVVDEAGLGGHFPDCLEEGG